MRGWSLSASLPTALLERTNPAWPGALSAAVHQPNNPNPARGRTRRRATTCGASRRSACSTKSRSSKISPSRSARRATLHVPESLHTCPSRFTRTRAALHEWPHTIGVARPRRRAPPSLSENRHRPVVDRRNEPPARRRSCHSSCTTTSSSAARSSRRATTRHARRSAPCSSRSVQRYNPTSRLKIDIEKH